MNCSPVKEILTHCTETRHGAKDLLTVEKNLSPYELCGYTPFPAPDKPVAGSAPSWLVSAQGEARGEG